MSVIMSKEMSLNDAVAAGAVEKVQRLLQEGADVNEGARDCSGPALFSAIQRREHQIARILLQAGADPHATFADGMTPLHLAAAENDTKGIEILLGAGADPNMATGYGTALHFASLSGTPATVERLLQAGADPNVVAMQGGVTPLHCAAGCPPAGMALPTREGRGEALRLLLAAGADPHMINCDGKTPLQCARFNGCADAVAVLEATVSQEREETVKDDENLVRNADALMPEPRKSDKSEREHIDELLRFLPIFDEPDHKKLHARVYAPSDPNRSREAGPAYTGEAEGLMRLLAREPWPDRDYLPEQAEEMIQDDRVIATATLVQVRTMLTYAHRIERFCEGGWGRMLMKGRVTALLKRLRDLRDEQSEEGPMEADRDKEKGERITHTVDVGPGGELTTTMNISRDAGDAARKLMEAIVRDSEKNLAALLNSGIDPNTPIESGAGALHALSAFGRPGLLETLLAHGADVNMPADDGSTPLHSAVKNENRGVVLGLLKHGAGTEVFGGASKGTPLHLAAIRGYGQICEALLDAGANANSRSKEDNLTPLHVAAYAGAWEVVQLLCERGADVNARDNDGMTALHAACLSNSVKTVRCLLDAGAATECRTTEGQTPHELARSMKKTKIAKVLKEVMTTGQSAGKKPKGPKRTRQSPPEKDTLEQRLVSLLRKAGRPLKLKEIYSALGADSTAGTAPIRGVFNANRKGLFARVGRGEYTLREMIDSQL